MAGIYFHIPFCQQACHYCNFFFTTSKRFINSTTEAMLNELEYRKDYLSGETIQTIYFGGGTPSMLPPSEIQTLIDGVKNSFSVDSELEITLEANPDNLTKPYLEELKKTDVNRFSIGIQSFHQDELLWMNRAHNSEEATRCLELVESYQYDHYSVDLILGIPISSREKWQQNLDILSGFRPKHVSCYALTVEPKTALDYQIKNGKSPAIKDTETEEQFYMAHDFLSKKGYKHYEISNYGLPGYAAKHNSSYWEGKKYLGIGPSAHSYNRESRSWNIAHLPKYLEGVNKGQLNLETENLSKVDQYNEFVMTNIRKSSGISLEILKQNFAEYIEHFDDSLLEIPKTFLNRKQSTISLSREGLMFADFVGSALFYVV